MIDLSIAKFHGENVVRLTNIENRIISIDGNGTGRIGAVQRIEGALSTLTAIVESLKNSLGEVKIDVGGSLKTKAIWGAAASIGVIMLGAAGTIFAGWFQHVMGWR